MKKLYAICQIFCAIFLMSFLVGTASAQIVVTNGNPYTTGFENGLEDWTTQANLGTDVNMLQKAQQQADLLLEADPELSLPEHAPPARERRTHAAGRKKRI